MIQEMEQLLCPVIILPKFQTEGALSDSGQKRLHRQELGDFIFQAKALETRRGEDNALKTSGFELIETGIHIPPQGHNDEVGAYMK